MHLDELGAAVVDDQASPVAEWSRDGALMVQLASSGHDVFVQLEPQVMSWPAPVLAGRIVRLHRLAMMRARAQLYARLAHEQGLSPVPPPGYPSAAEVDEYRRTIDF